MLQQVSESSYSFVRLSNIPLYVYATFFVVVQTLKMRSTLIKNILNTAIVVVVVVQSPSHVQLFNPMDCIQRAKISCLSLPSGVCANSCPLSRWCHPTISSSATPFSCLQSFPASECFPVSQLFTSCGQSIGASASASVLQWIFRTDFL